MTLVCVRTFASRATAETARCALQSAGIDATISAADVGYDVTLAQGGARLLVPADALDAARRILQVGDTEPHDEPSLQPFHFSLKALLTVVTLAAISLGGYAVNGIHGALCFLVSPVLAAIGIQVIRSLEGRRSFQKPFVLITGLGFVGAAIGYFVWGLR